MENLINKKDETPTVSSFNDLSINKNIEYWYFNEETE